MCWDVKFIFHVAHMDYCSFVFNSFAGDMLKTAKLSFKLDIILKQVFEYDYLVHVFCYCHLHWILFLKRFLSMIILCMCFVTAKLSFTLDIILKQVFEYDYLVHVFRLFYLHGYIFGFRCSNLVLPHNVVFL